MPNSSSSTPSDYAPPPSSPKIPAYRYNAELAGQIECQWQKCWDEQDAFVQPNPGQPGFDATKPKFYCLDMFPYPSGAGLHVGHPEGYTATDIICRYKRLKGFNVLHPMGWDAFGLPAEQYAIETGVHPAKTTRKSIDNFRRQLKRFGFSYDWTREFGTIDPDYYRWTQWIFLKLYNSWFDPDQNRAAPINELVEAFESGRRTPAYNPEAAEYADAGDLPSGATADAWDTLDPETRRTMIDSYRLAYISRQLVNWCPKLGTALANEEVIDGRSERGGFPVYRKPLRQWMLRITSFAERLLNDLELVDWPSSTRTQQAEWIGRSEGAEIDFSIMSAPSSSRGFVRIYTTRPDTIFGATYMVVAPEHPLVQAVLDEPGSDTDAEKLHEYVQWARNRTDIERQGTTDKTGCALGLNAKNPATGKPIPIWTADYVLMGYGHGAIMAVPAHDQRDYDFAREFNLPITRVVEPSHGNAEQNCAYAGTGVSINSTNDKVSLDNLSTDEAKTQIVNWLEAQSLGRKKVNFKLRDWLFSRQRYWGEPFPIVYDQHGDHHSVDESALPVTLPDMQDYKPEISDDPQPLLAKATDWVKTTAGAAQISELDPDEPVTRETNTMPGWAGSCWYYLRYCGIGDSTRLVDRGAERYWMLSNKKSAADSETGDTYQAGSHHAGGVDLYVGGAEHAVLHLLYARFWHKVLFDLGEVSTPEPFGKLFHQGLITSFAYQRQDKTLVPVDQVQDQGDEEYIEIATGKSVSQITAKMSKSLKNVVNPDEVIDAFGADTFRLYEMYMGPLASSKPWNTRDIIGMHRFLQRAWRLAVDEETGNLRDAPSPDEAVERQLHRAIAQVGRDIENMGFNTAIAAMIELVNIATKVGADQEPSMTADQIERFALILSPFAPHMAEELWQKLSHDTLISKASWPSFDPAMLVDDQVEIAVQILGKVRSRVMVPADADAKALEAAALADDRIKSLLKGKTIRKVIAIPGRMVNIVAN